VPLASGSDDATVRIWDPATAEPQAIREDNPDQVKGLCGFAVDSHVLLASADNDSAGRIWDLATGQHKGRRPARQLS
jgi:WD40 repeat protein